ncbi:MAG: putative OPT family oligopeptide transporter [Planctomycetota bacterium]|jgi:putative OPT family oligopeptide transporter
MKRDFFPILFGVLVSTVLAGTLVIAGLKAGITPGVSPLVILCAWGAFASRATSPGGRRFLNLAQVAGSAGMAVTAGVIFVAPLVQILYVDKGLEAPPVDVITLITLSMAGALVGFGFVGLATKKFLSDPTLPAPEARACEAMIEAAASDPEARPRMGRSLVAGLILSFMAPLVEAMGIAKGHIELMHRERGDRVFSLELPMSPIYIGIGGLLTLSTALLVFGGSFLRLAGDAMLAGVEAGSSAAAIFPANSMRWVGGGAMTIAVIYSLKRFMGKREAVDKEAVGDLSLLEVDPSVRRGLLMSIAAGMAIFLGWLIWKEGGITAFAGAMTLTILVMATIMVTLGAILSLQIGSSASPVSGTIFVTTLVLCLVALMVGRNTIDDVLLITPLLVGACVAVCTANDSSQDYKTMQLCGVRVQDGFLAQILGLLAGCVVVPIAVYIAHDAYVLGSESLPAPQGQMFATLVNGLLLDRELPWWPIIVGCAIGLFAVLMDIAADKRGIQLPSMALAVGIYLPAYLGVGILIGALFRYMGDRGKKQPGESILAAAGLITGAAALELGLGIAIMSGFDIAKLEIFDLGPVPMNVAGLIGILLLGGIIYINSKPQRRSSD